MTNRAQLVLIVLLSCDQQKLQNRSYPPQANSLSLFRSISNFAFSSDVHTEIMQTECELGLAAVAIGSAEIPTAPESFGPDERLVDVQNALSSASAPPPISPRHCVALADLWRRVDPFPHWGINE